MINYSIIIPHYNIPDLLVRCLKSIPVREDVQVIVVDDCSPDYSTYKERYPELSRPYLEFYQTPKGGSAGRARNIGLQHAKGKWILFADADDFFVPDMYQLISSHCRDNADVIFFKANSVDAVSLEPAFRHIDRNNSIDSYLNGTCNCVETILQFTVVWATMYSAEFVRQYDIRFDETLCGNDIMFAVKAAHLATIPNFCDQYLYVITYRKNSLDDKKLKDYRSYVVHQVVHTRLDKYCKGNNIRYRQPICVISDIRDSFRRFGLKAAWMHISLTIKDKTLFFGLKEASKRKMQQLHEHFVRK